MKTAFAKRRESAGKAHKAVNGLRDEIMTWECENPIINGTILFSDEEKNDLNNRAALASVETGLKFTLKTLAKKGSLLLWVEKGLNNCAFLSDLNTPYHVNEAIRFTKQAIEVSRSAGDCEECGSLLDPDGAECDCKKPVYVNVKFPSLNKNNTLEENDKRIAESSNVNRCRIDKVVRLDSVEFGKVSKTLMIDNDLWEKIGGTSCDNMTDEEFKEAFHMDTENSQKLQHKFYKNCYTHVVKAISSHGEVFYVNTEGYSYARYVGRIAA